VAIHYGLNSPGIESAADRLLGFQVRILAEAWMFVLCVLYSRDKRQKARTIQTKKRVRLKYNDNNKENLGVGEIFCTRPDRLWGALNFL
jgi:hypothetical protein